MNFKKSYFAVYTMGQPNFHPVYKVKCCASHVEYKLYIDALTGIVLSSKADVDDDLF